MSRTFAFSSADGTRLQGWTNGGDGTPLVLSNGLGTIPQAWPALASPGCGYAAISWYHRGTFASERPADPARIGIDDHVDDLVALMDDRGVERALVASWSIGVNVAFELALRHPERVAGLLAVSGVPGGTFSTMGGPLRVPRRLRRPVATRVARAAVHAGPALTWLAPKVPIGERGAWLLSRSGFMLPGADPAVLAPMLEEFVRQDWQWYFRLAVAAADHEPVDLARITCPVTLVAGRHDVLTSMHDMVQTAQALPDAEVTVLPGSHFLPMEHAGLVAAALDGLAERSGGAA